MNDLQNGGSCSHVDVDSTKIRCGSSGWFSQRQECHSHCEDIGWAEEEFYRAEFLGERILCVHSG